MSWLEEKYIRTAFGSYRNFIQKNANLYNFSCPICGDSATDLRKARGYLYVSKQGNWRYKCQNCGENKSFYEFLEEQDARAHAEYVFEKFQEDNTSRKKSDKKDDGLSIEDLFSIRVDGKLRDHALRCDLLNDVHPAKQYLNKRKIPLSKHSEMYYTDDINDLKKLFPSYEDVKFYKQPRIIIPVQNVQKILTGVITRAINEDARLRYVNLTLKDEPLIYGLDKINFSETKYVVEGPLDSMFLDNAVAVAGADLIKCVDLLDDNTVYIFDNQPRNPEIVSRMKRMAGMNKKIVIWPEDLVQKDINDMILANVDVRDIINKHTYKSLEALLYIAKWSKC